MLVDSMFVYHFDILLILTWYFLQMSKKKFMQISRKCLLSCFFFCFFWWQKIAFKSSLGLCFHPSITEFRMKENIHTKVVVDVSRGAGGSFFLGEIRGWVSRNLFSQVKLYQRIWKWNLNQKLIMALLIVVVCTVLF